MMSSGEECVDLEQELPSSESSSSEESVQTQRVRKKMRQELEISLKSADEEEEVQTKEGGGTSGFYKVIGQTAVEGSLDRRRKVIVPFVANACKFSAKLGGNAKLFPLDALKGLRSEFIDVLRTYTDVWFPVQSAVLPTILNGLRGFFPPKDLIICSPTGSGKTLCYLLPILNGIEIVEDASAVFALVVAPAVTLAQQIFLEFKKFNVFGARIVALYGKEEYATERLSLFPECSSISKAHVIVATPGRLIEHLMDTSGGVLNLSMLRFLVVDEADRMQNIARMEWLDFLEQQACVPNASNILSLASIADSARHNCWLQRILVSATLSLDVQKLYTWNLRCPQLFQATADCGGVQKIAENSDGLGTAFAAADNEQIVFLPQSLVHKLISCQSKMKPLILLQQIESHLSEWRRVIVFVNKRITCNRLAFLLKLLGDNKIIVAELSSNLFRSRLLSLLKRFRSGKIRILIACDIFSRGIDVENVDCVVNYDVPINERIFVHRAGRTARGMKSGLVLSLCTKEERMRLKNQLVSKNLWEGVEDLRSDDGGEPSQDAISRYREALAHLGKRATTSKSRRKR